MRETRTHWNSDPDGMCCRVEYTTPGEGLLIGFGSDENSALRSLYSEMEELIRYMQAEKDELGRRLGISEQKQVREG